MWGGFLFGLGFVVAIVAIPFIIILLLWALGTVCDWIGF